eukprot:GFYU01002722.1.p1 GENE.GFYU01002722.1~~GFYU01002722.1.p1  ORF type:complete len:509 (+),score=72.64 GFYU01002722.1:258-1784(+)
MQVSEPVSTFHNTVLKMRKGPTQLATVTLPPELQGQLSPSVVSPAVSLLTLSQGGRKAKFPPPEIEEPKSKPKARRKTAASESKDDASSPKAGSKRSAAASEKGGARKKSKSPTPKDTTPKDKAGTAASDKAGSRTSSPASKAESNSGSKRKRGRPWHPEKSLARMVEFGMIPEGATVRFAFGKMQFFATLIKHPVEGFALSRQCGDKDVVHSSPTGFAQQVVRHEMQRSFTNNGWSYIYYDGITLNGLWSRYEAQHSNMNGGVTPSTTTRATGASKQAGAATSGQVGEQSASPAKRKPGRPPGSTRRKVVESDPAAGADAANGDGKGKRKRGRPKKIAVPPMVEPPENLSASGSPRKKLKAPTPLLMSAINALSSSPTFKPSRSSPRLSPAPTKSTSPRLSARSDGKPPSIPSNQPLASLSTSSPRHTSSPRGRRVPTPPPLPPPRAKRAPARNIKLRVLDSPRRRQVFKNAFASRMSPRMSPRHSPRVSPRLGSPANAIPKLAARI